MRDVEDVGARSMTRLKTNGKFRSVLTGDSFVMENPLKLFVHLLFHRIMRLFLESAPVHMIANYLG